MPSDPTDAGSGQQRFIRPPLQDAPPKSDLSNSVFEDVELQGRDLNQCLFTESFFRRCRFTEVDFNNSDFDGTRFEECEFLGCDFGDCDIRAASIQHSRFTDCSFKSVYLSDTTFEAVQLTRSTFASAALAENSFAGTTFRDCNLTRSTLTRSSFDECRFIDMTLGDCTFLYIIVNRSDFENCVLNAESIGMIFGLTRADLARFRFMFLGQLQEAPDGSALLESITHEYRKRGWILGLTILRLNFGLTSALFAIRDYIAAIWRQVENNRSPKRDDLQFFSKVLSELARHDRLPMLGCMDVIEMTWRALDVFETKPSMEARHAGAALHRLNSELLLIAEERLGYFNSRRIDFENFGNDMIVEASFLFDAKPSIPVVSFVEFVTVGSLLTPLFATISLTTSEGSYIEKVRTTLITLFAAQMAVFLLNGAVIQLTELKERVKLLVAHDSGTQYVTRALDPNQQIPPVLQRPLENLTQTLRASEIVNSPDLRGYSENNLRNIKVETAPKHPKAPATGAGTPP